jgi:PTH1 family peptidyl-tRNA hydrolase
MYNPDMKLFFGLGNFEDKYQHTRHNFGASLIKQAVLELNLAKLNSPGNIPSTVWKHNQCLFAISSTYMNESGLAVAPLARYFKIELTDIYIVHDDLDLPVGDWKLQYDRGPAGHNGLKSIIEQFGSQAFNRYRLGINHPRNSQNPSMPVEDYVLLPFTKEDHLLVERTIADVITDIKTKL